MAGSRHLKYLLRCLPRLVITHFRYSCPVSTTDGAAIGFRIKVINFCLFTFNDDMIRQICFLMYDFFFFFIFMLYYIFFYWNSCNILLIYSNVLVEHWFLLSTISTIFSVRMSVVLMKSIIHMFGQTTRKLVKIALLILFQTNLKVKI